ncbi:hypothetical protein EON63_04270 [archaeon]|nr:MAG: hypothetical protein EON63_04270 [archaeon]
MHLGKRETSVCATDYHFQNMADSIKKLAIAKDGQPHAIPSIVPPKDTHSIMTVMSNAQDDFNSRYELVREIGKGGFSTVYQCRNRNDGKDYAVKVQ